MLSKRDTLNEYDAYDEYILCEEYVLSFNYFTPNASRHTEKNVIAKAEYFRQVHTSSLKKTGIRNGVPPFPKQKL